MKIYTLAVIFCVSCPAQITHQIDQIFEQWDKPDSPGCAVGVYQNGQTIYKHGYGMANLNDDVPITPATVFHVASMSKQFTAASIVLLAQQGKLSLDDDVHKYIPELHDFGQPIILRELMHHTSGLRDQWALLGLAGWRYSQDLITDDDVMQVVTRQKDLNFKPGETFLYSNTGYTLLALIVKRVSGMSLREFTTKNIFGPLGMTHTHFRDDHEEIIKHDALGYEQSGKDKPFRMSLTNFDTVGATSLHTTVEDLQLWDENFYHPRVGGPEFLKQMLDRGKLNNGEQLNYASGLEVSRYRGLTTVEHGGADAGYRSGMTRFPDQHFSAAVLCNSAEANPIGLIRKIADIVLAKDFKASAEPASPKKVRKDSRVALTEKQTDAIVGMYRRDESYSKVVVKNGKLEIEFDSEGIHVLKSVGEGRFHIANVPRGDDMEVRFFAASGTNPKRMEQSFQGAEPKVFGAVTAFEPTAAELTAFAGDYLSDEIDPVYRVAVRDGELRLMRLKNDPEILRPATLDVFTGDTGTVHFTRDAAHHISGFLINSGRIKGFRFTRKTG